MANVICPNCGESYHETTDAYNPTVTTTGNMLRLKKKYVLNGWTSFPEHEGMKHGDLWCPGCEGAYSSDGKVRVDVDAEEQGRREFPGTEYATAEIKEAKRKPGRPKRA